MMNLALKSPLNLAMITIINPNKGHRFLGRGEARLAPTTMDGI